MALPSRCQQGLLVIYPAQYMRTLGLLIYTKTQSRSVMMKRLLEFLFRFQLVVMQPIELK